MECTSEKCSSMNIYCISVKKKEHPADNRSRATRDQLGVCHLSAAKLPQRNPQGMNNEINGVFLR